MRESKRNSTDPRRNRVQLYLTDSEFETIAKLADQEQLSVSTKSRELLAEAVANKLAK